MDTFEALALLVLFAFLPPLLFAWRLRNAERRRREPWSRILAAFFWGAFAAVVFAILGEQFALLYLYDGTDPVVRFPGLAVTIPFLAVIVAPIVEETAKMLGLLRLRDVGPEPENGYVYGGAVGLGFAATENLVYIASAFLLAGAQTALVTGLFRGVATVALHAGATAITGYGVWRARFGRRRVVGLVLLPFSLLVAILIHAVYNALASVEFATLLAVAFALVVWAYVHWRVRWHDRRA